MRIALVLAKHCACAGKKFRSWASREVHAFLVGGADCHLIINHFLRN